MSNSAVEAKDCVTRGATVRRLCATSIKVAFVLVGLWAGTTDVLAAPCPAANPSDGTPDDAALQACLNAGGTIDLVPGNPGYIIRDGLVLTVNGTELRGVGGKARLLAHPDLGQPVILVQGGRSGWSMYELIVDGNLDNRTYKDTCTGYRGWASNILAKGSNFVIHHVDTVNTMCGSALEVDGTSFEIYSVYAANSGREPSAPNEAWADGITLLNCSYSNIHDNYVQDATDIGIVVGQGINCYIHHNTIANSGKAAFAGFHVGAFGNWNQAGSVYEYNTISSGYDKMAFGMVVGFHPWNATTTIPTSGTVNGNSISGAVVNLAVDGIDTGTVSNNTFSNHRGSAGWDGCTISEDYTAYHYGSATLQAGWLSRYFHPGACGI